MTQKDAVSAPASTAFAPPAEQTPVDTKLENETSEDIPCPLTTIQHEARERATEMADNLQSLTATEQIKHAEFKKNGQPHKSASQLFSYVAETQNDSAPPSDTGAAAFALIFHPQKIGNFEIRCERRTNLQGTPSPQLL